MKKRSPYQEFGETISRARKYRSREWLATQLGLAINTISDYELGKKQPPARTIAELAALLDLNPTEIAELARLSPGEIDDAKRLFEFKKWPWPNTKNFIEEMRNQINQAAFIRKISYPQAAINSLVTSKSHLETRINLQRDHWKDIKEMRALLVYASNELIASHSEILLPYEVLDPIIPIFCRTKGVAEEIGDRMGVSCSHVWLSGAYYVNKNYLKSIEHSKIAIAMELTPTMEAEAIRILMLNYGYLYDKKGFLETEKKMLSDLDQGRVTSPLDISALLEGGGRARALLRLSGADKMFESAEREITSAETREVARPVRSLQVLRSKLVKFVEDSNAGVNIDIDKVKEIAIEAFKIANIHGYKRHIQQIKRLASSLGIRIERNEHTWG